MTAAEFETAWFLHPLPEFWLSGNTWRVTTSPEPDAGVIVGEFFAEHVAVYVLLVHNSLIGRTAVTVTCGDDGLPENLALRYLPAGSGAVDPPAGTNTIHRAVTDRDG